MADRVVILVHGIRTHAPWIAMIRSEFERAGLIVQPTNYGRFDVLRFLWGSPRSSIDQVWEAVEYTRQRYPGAKICFLAHSFGTYIVARILQRQLNFRADRVVFCGSVVNYRFPFAHLSNRYDGDIINEASGRDIWPIFAESATFGYGTGGTYGFKTAGVRDRWHKGFGHSQYLTKEFCQKYWIPFFKDGRIQEGDLLDDTPPLWVRFIDVVKLKFAIPLIALLLVGAFHYKVFPFNPTLDLFVDPNKCYEVPFTDTSKNPPERRMVWHCPPGSR